MSTSPFPNKDTGICISLSSRPGNFGCLVHNAAYRQQELNFIYKACSTQDVRAALEGVRALGIRGCSISMPFKQEVIPLLDRLDPVAEHIGAVNTIVNDDGCLIGMNTDSHGAQTALTEAGISKDDCILLIGAGGVAVAIDHALKQCDLSNRLYTNRHSARYEQWTSPPDKTLRLDWTDRAHADVTWIINATSVGMAPYANESPTDLVGYPSLRGVMDVVVQPVETKLLRSAQETGKQVIYGYQMSLYQAAYQYELYTGHKAPIDTMGRVIREHLGQR